MKSNIVAASNVHMSREDNPFRDPEYAAQIQDYDKVWALSKGKDYDSKVVKLTAKQETILKIGMRCVYAKKDPCFGYVDEKHRLRCACINGNCSEILKCNPEYTEEDAKFWTTSDEERALYGIPSKLREYYIVDIVSDEEMLRYECNPYNEGIEFPLIPEPVIKEELKTKKSEKSKIDPLTGRKMIIVGYKWVITDNASYESDELVPIWGFAKEVEESRPQQQPMRKRAKRIEKLDTAKQKKPKKKNIAEDGFEKKADYESIVKEKAVEKIGLGDLDEADDLGARALIVCNNPAELALISDGLVKSRIDHGYKPENDIRLVVIDDFDVNDKRVNVYLTSEVIKRGCTNECYKQWEYLSNQSELTIFSLSSRSYVDFEFGDHKRWCCQNMYGITHVCLVETDFDDMDDLDDGVYNIYLMLDEDDGTYRIENLSGKVLGEISVDFVSDINKLAEKNEIQNLPVQIDGIQIEVKDCAVTVLGIGHLEFDSY